MDNATIWWLMAVGAVGMELATGTFYLLMLALGLVAGALTAHAGGGQAAQLLAAALVGGGSVVGCYLVRRPGGDAPHEAGNRDINLDIGETVQVDTWAPDGTAHVQYRGAQWTALPAGTALPQAGAHRVREVIGSRLVLEKI